MKFAAIWGDGKEFKAPISNAAISDDLAIWEGRFRNAWNSQSRYALVVWEFSQPIRGQFFSDHPIRSDPRTPPDFRLFDTIFWFARVYLKTTYLNSIEYLMWVCGRRLVVIVNRVVRVVVMACWKRGGSDDAQERLQLDSCTKRGLLDYRKSEMMQRMQNSV